MTKIWGLPRWTLWSSPMEFQSDNSITAPNSSRPRTCDQRECGSNTLGSANRLSTGTSRWPQKLTLRTPVLSTRSDGSCSNPGSSFTIARSTGSCNSGIRTHVLEILHVITALFEFTARMADQTLFTNHVGIAVELNGVAGRELAWPGEANIDGWSQEDAIGIDNTYTAEEFRAGRRILALDTAIAIYAAFGWNDRQKDKLQHATATIRR